MEKIIRYFGHLAKVACDEKCDKAWGTIGRPRIQLSDDEDDYEYLSDKELGQAPANTGVYEDGQDKPASKEEIPNKWCVRECERCAMSLPGKHMEPLPLKDFSVRIRNIPL